MARQRNLKPTFFTNEDLGECTPLARLFFAGLWCWADREGYLEDRPRRLRAEILPYDQVDGEQLVLELVGKGLLERLEVDGERVLRIPTFLKHQNPHPRETPSRFAQGAPLADQGMEEQQGSPASPSHLLTSSPSHLPVPPCPPSQLASVPDWLAGVKENLERELHKALAVGKDPVAVVEMFTRRRDYLAEQGYPDPESTLVGDCLAVAKKARESPGTLAFFVGWLDRHTPKPRRATP
jgi:hypothetical protein